MQDSDSDTDSDASTAEDVVVTIHNSDGTSTSAQQHELAIAAELAKQPAWFGGGRFSGREGKMARIRQQEALAAAKLGLACPKAELVSPAAAPKVSKKQQVKLVTEAAAPKVSKKRKAKLVTDAAAQLPLPTTAAGVAVPEVSSGKQKSSKKQKSAQAMLQPPAAPSDQEVETAQAEPVRKRIIIEPAFTPAPAAPFIQTPASGWWGAKKFTSAGTARRASL